MTYLIALMALVGQPVALWTDGGVCTGRVIAPGQMVIQDGSCSLSDESAQLFLNSTGSEDGPVGLFSKALRLESGRVLVHFTGVSK